MRDDSESSLWAKSSEEKPKLFAHIKASPVQNESVILSHKNARQTESIVD